MSNILQEIEAQIAGVKTTTTKQNVGIVREIGDMVVDHTGLHPLSGGGERPPSVRRQYR